MHQKPTQESTGDSSVLLDYLSFITAKPATPSTIHLDSIPSSILQQIANGTYPSPTRPHFTKPKPINTDNAPTVAPIFILDECLINGGSLHECLQESSLYDKLFEAVESVDASSGTNEVDTNDLTIDLSHISGAPIYNNGTINHEMLSSGVGSPGHDETPGTGNYTEGVSSPSGSTNNNIDTGSTLPNLGLAGVLDTSVSFDNITQEQLTQLASQLLEAHTHLSTENIGGNFAIGHDIFEDSKETLKEHVIFSGTETIKPTYSLIPLIDTNDFNLFATGGYDESLTSSSSDSNQIHVTTESTYLHYKPQSSTKTHKPWTNTIRPNPTATIGFQSAANSGPPSEFSTPSLSYNPVVSVKPKPTFGPVVEFPAPSVSYTVVTGIKPNPVVEFPAPSVSYSPVFGSKPASPFLPSQPVTPASPTQPTFSSVIMNLVKKHPHAHVIVGPPPKYLLDKMRYTKLLP